MNEAADIISKFYPEISKKPGCRGAGKKESFWSKVNKNGPIPDQSQYPGLGPCWEWTGGKFHFGHGRFRLFGKNLLAHRISWLIANGGIPDGLDVLHKCDNPPCVNPAHLYVGTQADNNSDRDSRGRQVARRGEANGNSRLTLEQVIEIKRLLAAGELQKNIAPSFGTTKATISMIATKASWAWVP